MLNGGDPGGGGTTVTVQAVGGLATFDNLVNHASALTPSAPANVADACNFRQQSASRSAGRTQPDRHRSAFHTTTTDHDCASTKKTQGYGLSSSTVNCKHVQRRSRQSAAHYLQFEPGRGTATEITFRTTLTELESGGRLFSSTG